MKIKPGVLSFVIVAVVTLLAFALPCVSQLQEIAEAKLLPADKAPQSGTFFSLTLVQPPFPFNPFPDLPVYKIGKGLFVYDDRKVDYQALRAELAVLEAQKAALEANSFGTGGGGQMSLMFGSGDTNLMLSIPVVQGTNVLMSIVNAITNEPYDLFGTATLGATNPWTYLGRVPAGQTNATAPQFAGSKSVAYTTANTFDTDGDTLPDAVETLVTQTNPQFPDSTNNVPPGSTAANLLTEIDPWLRVGTYSRDEQNYWYCSDNSIAGWTILDNWVWGTGGSSEYPISITCALPGTPKQTNSGVIVTWDGDGNPTPTSGASVPVDWIGIYTRILVGNPALNHYKDYVTAQLALRTGGKALSTKQHLYMFTPTADYWPGPQWGTPVPTEDITMFGDHPDENGHIWRLFPDNAKIQVPFSLPEYYTEYIYHGGMRKLQLRITRNGNDITDKQTVVWVGQDISLQCDVKVLPSNSSGSVAASNFVWTVPGNTILNYVADGSTGKVYRTFPVTNSNVNYYWVDQLHNGLVRCTAQVNGFTVEAKALFEVKRPTATLSAQITGTIAIDNNYENGLLALHFGWNPVGIIFDYPGGAEGQWEFVQLVNSYVGRQKDSSDNKWYRAQGSGLDTFFPYPKFRPPTGTSDSPGMQVLEDASEATLDFSYTMYLMFRPAGGIFVPIRKIGWGINAHATKTGTWSLTSGSPQVDASDADTTSHPEWTDNYSNFKNDFQEE